ncbi:Hsp20/alpha crystallin family protein [Dactylosporangium aurantiacum]|uniref:Hsp20/alpha crystallin family protein n=1 Tax=Dactylosporangium aurantiacum TaxID=35754 RepID=A0A9Q9IKM2_9ACTN|nr:Hsp20/alpha crystallin family protein [Dactylosporangium aurantiacum]MDG6105927.1 Hsp20/alpha crystallin family protein [Dactylosporangium aurantiacum]UWZ57902.1 Hsp20/alpha crystallin family protein [Dactylosporangium aurantiacum]
MLATRLRTAPLMSFDLNGPSWFPFTEPAIRIEDDLDEDRYTVRAELPGVDPAKDVDIAYADGVLRLSVTRAETQRDKGHSEFRYGTFHRTVQLPPGAKDETLSAVYRDGILEVTVAVGEPRQTGRHIPVTVETVKPVRKTG